MKNWFFLLFFAFSLLTSSTAQSLLEPEWVITKHTSPDTLAEGWGVDVDEDGNVYWPINTDSLNQGLDIVCYKYNENGEELWANPTVFGGPGAQQSYVCNVTDGYVYIGGKNCPFLAPSCDMFLVKIDAATGEALWSETMAFSSFGYDEVDGLEIIGDQIYCGGWAQEHETGLYNNEIGLWSLDTAGNTNWTNYFGQPGFSEHQDGHFVVDENYIYAAGLWEGTGLGNLYDGQSFLGTFSKTDGSFVDSTLFGSPLSSPAAIENALGMTSDGEYLYITGYTTPVSTNDWQIFVAKYDKNLNQIWLRDWGSTGTETARGIAVHDGKIYIAGQTESEDLAMGGASDGLLLIYDDEGNVLEAKTWGGAEGESFRDIVLFGDDVYLSGTSEGESMSAFLLKVGEVVDTEDLTTGVNTEKITVFPNPSDGAVQVDYFIESRGQLLITDVLGRHVSTRFCDAGEQIIQYDLPATGVYFFCLKTEDGILVQKVVSCK